MHTPLKAWSLISGSCVALWGLTPNFHQGNNSCIYPKIYCNLICPNIVHKLQMMWTCYLNFKFIEPNLSRMEKNNSAYELKCLAWRTGHFFGLSLGQLSSIVWATVACLKLQTSVQNGKSIFVSCFPINVDEIRSNDWPWEDLGPP